MKGAISIPAGEENPGERVWSLVSGICWLLLGGVAEWGNQSIELHERPNPLRSQLRISFGS